jgi:hypothetical protein
MEVSKTNKTDIVVLAKIVTSVGTEYATLKSASVPDVDFGQIIKMVCSRHSFDDLFGHLPYETAVGQYFGRSKKQKAELDIVMLSAKRVRVRVGVCSFAEYTIVTTSRRGSAMETVALRHHANIRPKGVRYDDRLMHSSVIEKHALAWVKEQDRRKPKAVR